MPMRTTDRTRPTAQHLRSSFRGWCQRVVTAARNSAKHGNGRQVCTPSPSAEWRPGKPSAKCRRVGLDYPSWLILDEYSRMQVDEGYDLVTTTPIGAFSPAFVRKIAGVIKETAAQRRLRGIVRK
jgi:hypothetical protein